MIRSTYCCFLLIVMLAPGQSRSQVPGPDAIVMSVTGAWRSFQGRRAIRVGDSLNHGDRITALEPGTQLRIYSLSEQMEKTFEGPASIVLLPPPQSPGFLERLQNVIRLILWVPRREDVQVLAKSEAIPSAPAATQLASAPRVEPLVHPSLLRRESQPLRKPAHSRSRKKRTGSASRLIIRL